MTLDEICELPVRDVAEDDAVLLLWATVPKLSEALRVMSAWDFTYKSHAIWDKQLIGMGYWWRGQHELLQVGTRGKFSSPAPELREPSVFSEKRTAHSRKPLHYIEYIERAYPNHAKLELFGRQQRHGWTVWGNQAGVAH